MATSIINSLARELWKIRHPGQPITADPPSPESDSQKYPRTQGLSPDLCFELTTSRNQNLISPDEQNILRRSPVVFFGMSVGSHAALTWMMESRADDIRIVDPDTIDATNLNRLRFGWSDVGKTKVSVVSRLLKNINPHAHVAALTKTDAKNLEKLFTTPSPPVAIVDEIDDIGGKVLLRQLAKKYRLPLISAADIGDNIALDVERYDQDPPPEMFLGRVPEISGINIETLTSQKKIQLIIKLVGLEKNSSRMMESLLSVGKTISTWPQLGATATISGGLITTTLKKILTGEPVKSGRYYVSLDDLLVSDFNSPENIQSRSRLSGIIRQIFSL